MNMLFRFSCKNGHIKIAKWLCQLGADIHANHNEAFKNGTTEIVSWLKELNSRKASEIDNSKKESEIDNSKKEILDLKYQLYQIKSIIES